MTQKPIGNPSKTDCGFFPLHNYVQNNNREKNLILKAVQKIFGNRTIRKTGVCSVSALRNEKPTQLSSSPTAQS